MRWRNCSLPSQRTAGRQLGRQLHASEAVVPAPAGIVQALAALAAVMLAPADLDGLGLPSVSIQDCLQLYCFRTVPEGASPWVCTA